MYHMGNDAIFRIAVNISKNFSNNVVNDSVLLPYLAFLLILVLVHIHIHTHERQLS